MAALSTAAATVAPTTIPTAGPPAVAATAAAATAATFAPLALPICGDHEEYEDSREQLVMCQNLNWAQYSMYWAKDSQFFFVVPLS